ncbi:MAG: Gfo/Idh/MocA family oxidoreductase [Planctomycetia bacterium]
MTTQPLRVAVVGRTGRGDWGHAIDELWTAVEGTELVAVADESADGLAQAVERLGRAAGSPPSGFRDWRAMLAEVKPEIVSLCMRHIDCHAEMAIAAAEAGVQGIFLEKPFVRTAAEADAVIAACRASGTKLALAMVNRHSPTYAVVRDLVEDGRIGRLLELRGRGKEDARGGGEDLWVLGCHVLDMMADLGGAPRWCQATITRDGRPITPADATEGPEGLGAIAGDAVEAMYGLADGPVGFFASVREAGLKQPNFSLTLVGTKGAIHIRPDNLPHAYLREAPLWRVDKEVPWLPIGPEGIGAGLPVEEVDRTAERLSWARRASADLVAAIVEDREPTAGMFAGQTTVEMTAAAFASGLSGERIVWPMIPRGNPFS